ncbi:MAG: hypothetical protein QW379_00085 [Thermoplasmata archaeon]
MEVRSLSLLIAAAALVVSGFSGCLDGRAYGETVVSSEGTQGASWKELVPIKSAAIVGYDPNSYNDDYAYLAAVPSSTFYSKASDKVFSYPVLFFEPEREMDEKELVLNHGEGVRYFMEDWMTYCDGQLDRVQLIGTGSTDPLTALNISAARISTVKGGSPYRVARDIALSNWEYSKEAVVAVVSENYPKPKLRQSGSLEGTIPGSYTIKTEVIQGDKEVGITPVFHNFTIGEPYRYIQAHMTWHGAVSALDIILQRGKDPDLQIYDWKLGQVSAAANWNVLSGPTEDAGSYVYHWGEWGFGVTYMPTKAMEDAETGLTAIVPAPPLPDPPSPLTARYEIAMTLYPGIELDIPDTVPYCARDVAFELSWSGGAKLGLAVLGPEGAEIAYEATGVSPQQLFLNELGEGKYKVAVLKLENNNQDTQFKLTYEWRQNMTRTEGDCLASAANGAVLASLLNAPLLYAQPGAVPPETLEALDVLGVTKVHLVDLGGHGGDGALRALLDHRSLLQPKIQVERYTGYKSLYSRILGITKSQDAVFTTVDPWSYWFIGEDGPAGEHPKGLFIGPAALAAAHHGTPVLIVDNHGNLSCPKAWYNEFWRKAYAGRSPPSVGCMVLTGHSIYDFLEQIGIDREGKENIVTVADQFDIGTPWDRALVGASNSGRIMGSPVDASYWVSRSVLYNAVIFANPATSPEGVDMITGTESMVDPGPEVAGLATIEGIPVHATYPVVQTWVSYQHRFNERASKYWRCKYVTATGITPFFSPSDNEIDDGVNAKYGQPGRYWPDITTSEVVPFYIEKAGYESVYSTNFDDTMSNLNKGTIMWLEVMHGGNRDDGVVGFWSTKANHREKNPWRGYEVSGCTREPDTYTMNHFTGMDAMHRSVSDYDKDGVVIAIINQEPQTVAYGGLDFDRALENVHSMGFNGGSCLIANTYMHLTMVRHGSVFQVIDPWLTSWYASFAMATFARGIALGYTIGECYAEGIKHVGIEYLTGQWWWDIFENVVFYGDPRLRVWSPINGWDEPVPLRAGTSVGGHNPFGASGHPAAISSMMAYEAMLYAGVGLAVAAAVIIKWKKIRVRDIIRRVRRRG